MKSALVESHRERWRRIESGELTVVGMNKFTSTEPSPLTSDADGGILVVDPAVEAERRAALVQWREQRDQAAVQAGPRRARQSRPRREREHHAGHDRRRPRRRHHRRVVPGPARRVRRIPGADRSRRGRRGLERRRRRAARRGRAPQRRARPPAEVPGRQARPRRTLQRRRADRRARPRRRHGRRLRGDPPHPGSDRQLGGRGGGPRDRPLDPVRLARGADPLGPRRPRRRRGRQTCRWSWAGSFPMPTQPLSARPGWPRSTPPRTGTSTR